MLTPKVAKDNEPEGAQYELDCSIDMIHKLFNSLQYYSVFIKYNIIE